MARILLVHPGFWAFKAMAEDIAHYAGPDRYVLCMSQPEFEAIAKWAKPDSLGRLDAAFHFSLGSASILRRMKAARYGSLVANEGWCYDAYNPGNWRTNAMASERNARFGKQVAANLDTLICLTPRIWETAGEWNERAVVIPQGLNMDFWTAEEPGSDEGDEERGGIRVGWCGDIRGERSFKGYGEVLLPLIGRLGKGFDWQLNTKHHGDAMNRVAMRAWYRQLDVFVCTSINEGGPYPPFEAAACGCAVVSTDVGIVAEWEEIHELDMVVPPATNDRNVKLTLDALGKRLLRLREDAELLEKVGNVLRTSVIEHYNWKRIAPRWVEAMLGNE